MATRRALSENWDVGGVKRGQPPAFVLPAGPSKAQRVIVGCVPSPSIEFRYQE